MKIKDLKNLDQQAKSIIDRLTVVATMVEVKTTTTGKDYIQFVGVEGPHNVIIKKWDATEADKKFFENGIVYDLINVEGSFYNGTPQVLLTSKSEILISNVTLQDIMTTQSAEDLRAMKETFKALIRSVEDNDCRYLLNVAFGNTETVENFLSYPAAEGIHHAEKHGLLQHTIGVTNTAIAIAEAMFSTYGQNIPINMDILKTAALLHDYKKIEEYSIDNIYHGKLNENALIGHITLAQMFINNEYMNNKISKQTMIELCHCISAHHGKKEYGSPVSPSTIEAQILSSADFVDSRCKIMLEGFATMNPGEYAQKGTYALDSARLYYPIQE